MYPKKLRICVVEVDTDKDLACYSVNPFCSDKRIARPLSYFLQGGVDLSGIDKRAALPDVYADSDAIADGTVDMATDPRVSKFDIIDYVSNEINDARAKRSAEALTGEHLIK